LLTDLSETVSGWFTTVQENHQAITFNTHFKRSSSLQIHKKRPAFYGRLSRNLIILLLLSWRRVPPGDSTPVSKAARIPADSS
ncbi:TPA: hypothetical protein ACJIW1_002904, partial [Enterobacter cloacae]